MINKKRSIRNVRINDNIICQFWEDQKLTLYNSEAVYYYQELPWFDPSDYSDEEITNKISILLSFS